jgi:hypothetical protein
VDGHSHHEQKKQDLQESKKEVLVHARGAGQSKDGSQGWAGRKIVFVTCTNLCIFISHTLSANNIALCLGYK